MDKVLGVKALVPDEQVGQRHGEVVHGLLLEHMLLAIVDQAVETSVGCVVESQLPQGQSLIEYLFRLGIVVIHGGGRFLRSLCGFIPTYCSLFFLSEAVVGNP